MNGRNFISVISEPFYPMSFRTEYPRKWFLPFPACMAPSTAREQWKIWPVSRMRVRPVVRMRVRPMSRMRVRLVSRMFNGESDTEKFKLFFICSYFGSVHNHMLIVSFSFRPSLLHCTFSSCVTFLLLRQRTKQCRL